MFGKAFLPGRWVIAKSGQRLFRWKIASNGTMLYDAQLPCFLALLH